MRALRYAYYLVFVLAALLFWVVVYLFVLGAMPGDPACGFEPDGCPPPTLWRQLFNLIVVFGTIPATVLTFVFYRRWVRRKLNVDDRF
jgi:uncharacterized membrane protein YesL